MINYHAIWASINEESQKGSSHTQIARQIPSNGLFSVFLATDFRSGLRLLYVKLKSNSDILIDDLPRFRGLEISIASTSIAQYQNDDFLRLTQSIVNTDTIFELVISDICDRILKIENSKDLFQILAKVLNEWKLFFEKQENEILSIPNQKGLIGELYFLKDYLFPKYSFSESISFWTGSDRTVHDFQIKNKAIEIKTTSSKQHKKFTISSEKQLDGTGLEHLYLSLFSVILHSNLPNKTLPALVNEIAQQIQYDVFATFQFQIKLAKYGYNKSLENRYLLGFSIVEVKFFEVLSGFPRLLQSELPNGVGDLKYSVIVSACAPFEIKSDIQNHL